jgi:hypothetical protein
MEALHCQTDLWCNLLWRHDVTCLALAPVYHHTFSTQRKLSVDYVRPDRSRIFGKTRTTVQ